MIIDILFLIVSAFIWCIWAVFSLVNFAIPSAWVTALQQWFGYVGIFQGVLPIFPRTDMTGLVHDVGVLTILGWVFQLIIAKYAIRLVVWITQHLPFLNVKGEKPV